MPVALTEKEFSQHLNTTYRLEVDGSQSVELELVEVKPYENKDKPGEHAGMERFSLFFQGPADVYLPQRIYQLSHSQMGDLKLFLVPVARNERGFRYEAVFNHTVPKNAQA
jgi:hypothetical protein